MNKQVTALLKLYQKLFDLTRQEHEVIQENRFEKLGEILQDKQETIYLINRHPEAKKGPEKEKILQIMTEIKKLGDSNLEVLQEEIKVTGGKLEKLNLGWQNLQNYSNSSQGQPSIIDRRG